MYTVEELPKIVFQLLLHEGKSQPGSGPSNVCSKMFRICICDQSFLLNAWRNSETETNSKGRRSTAGKRGLLEGGGIPS